MTRTSLSAGPVAPVPEVPHKARPVLTPALVGDRHLTPAAERLEGHEQIGGAVAHVFVVIAFGLPRPVLACRARRQRGAHLADQLLAALVQADHRPLRVMRTVVDRQHVSMWNTNSAECWGGMHHIRRKCGLSAFFF